MLVWGGWRVSLRWRIHAELERIRAEGYPVTPVELDAWYAYPEGENAAEIYMQAFEAMVDSTAAEEAVLPIVGQGELPPVDEAIGPEVLAAMESYLARNTRTIELLHEAGKVEGCRWPGDLGEGIDAGFEQLIDVRRAARLLQLRADLNGGER